jgi:hypothetical protein
VGANESDLRSLDDVPFQISVLRQDLDACEVRVAGLQRKGNSDPQVSAIFPFVLQVLIDITG